MNIKQFSNFPVDVIRNFASNFFVVAILVWFKISQYLHIQLFSKKMFFFIFVYVTYRPLVRIFYFCQISTAVLRKTAYIFVIIFLESLNQFVVMWIFFVFNFEKSWVHFSPPISVVRMLLKPELLELWSFQDQYKHCGNRHASSIFGFYHIFLLKRTKFNWSIISSC